MTISIMINGVVEFREVRDGGWFTVGFDSAGFALYTAFAGDAKAGTRGELIGVFANEALAEEEIREYSREMLSRERIDACRMVTRLQESIAMAEDMGAPWSEIDRLYGNLARWRAVAFE